MGSNPFLAFRTHSQNRRQSAILLFRGYCKPFKGKQLVRAHGQRLFKACLAPGDVHDWDVEVVGYDHRPVVGEGGIR